MKHTAIPVLALLLALALVPATLAGGPDTKPKLAIVAAAPATDPRVCEEETAIQCSTNAAIRLSWHAAGGGVYAPSCIPTGTLKFRCLLHGTTAAIGVSWNPATFSPTIKIGTLAKKVLAASKARAAAFKAKCATGADPTEC